VALRSQPRDAVLRDLLARRCLERAALLRQARTVIAADIRISAAWVGGSVGRGESDALSDLDLYVAVADDQIGTVAAQRRTFVALIAALQTISAIVKSRLKPEFDWSTGYGQKAAAVSKYSFVIGIVLVAAVALGSWVRGRPPESRPVPILYIRDSHP